MQNENKNSRGRKRKEDDYNAPFAVRLRELITEKGISQEEAAEAAGVSRQALGKWVNGQTVPDIYSVGKLAKHFGISTDYLIGNTDTKTVDTDLQAVCNYTGLSEDVVESFRSMNEEEYEEYIDIVNKLMQSDDFHKLLHSLYEIKSRSEYLPTSFSFIKAKEWRRLLKKHDIDEEAFYNIYPFVFEGEDEDNSNSYLQIDVYRYKAYQIMEKIFDIFDERNKIDDLSKEEFIDRLGLDNFQKEKLLKKEVTENGKHTPPKE